MSTEKKHTIENVPGLTVVYLRNALNNPQWAQGMDDWVSGCDALRAVPKLAIPKGMTDDVEIFKWADATPSTFTLSDGQRDACRSALKKAFELKALPINEYATSLIGTFALKS